MTITGTVRTAEEIYALIDRPSVDDSGSSRFRKQDLADLFATALAEPPYVLNQNMSAAQILNALQAGGRVHFSAGTYNLSSLSANNLLSAALWITGDGKDITFITIGGTTKSIASERFRLRASTFYMEGVTVQTGSIFLSLEGIVSDVSSLIIRNCTFSNVGAAIYHNTVTTSFGTTDIGTVEFSNNIVRDSNSGVHLRIGQGGVGNNLPILRGIFNNNRLANIDKYGIVVNYDDSATTYPSESYAEACGNILAGFVGTASSVTGWGINLSAFKNVTIDRCWFEDFLCGTRTAIEPVYSKSFRTVVTNCWFIDCHDPNTSEGGGAVSNKAVEAGVQENQLFEVGHCYFINSVNDGVDANRRMENGIWIQGAGNHIHDCFFFGSMRTCIGVQGGTDSRPYGVVENCVARLYDCGGSEVGTEYRTLAFAGASLNNPKGWAFRNNHVNVVTGDTAGGTDFRAFNFDIAASDDLNDCVVEGNIITVEATVTNTPVGVRFTRSGGTLSNPSIIGNTFINKGTAFTPIVVTGSGITGVVRILDNHSYGHTTKATLTATGTTFDIRGNNWLQALITEAGAGITGGTGTVYKSTVQRIGDRIITEIFIDLTGLGSSTTDLDIIGQGVSVAHLGQIVALHNGTIANGWMQCLEVPVTGADDIDLYAATESTGVFDGGIAALTETALITAGGAWTLDQKKYFGATLAADKYLYLVNGEAGTVGTYTAGQFLIHLEGYV